MQQDNYMYVNSCRVNMSIFRLPLNHHEHLKLDYRYRIDEHTQIS